MTGPPRLQTALPTLGLRNHNVGPTLYPKLAAVLWPNKLGKCLVNQKDEVYRLLEGLTL